MRWLFGDKLSRQDRVVAERVIRHLQTMAAYQQLAMETYNDALFKVSGTFFNGDEMSVRGAAMLNDRRAAGEILLPAAQRKVSIIESMEAQHSSFEVPSAAKMALSAYEGWTELITVLLARARLQLTSIVEWIKGPYFELWERSSALDEAEMQSMDAAIARLNDFIRRAGLWGDPWLAINHEVFNTVRNAIGLPGLRETDFRSRFLQGLAGGHSRYFE